MAAEAASKKVEDLTAREDKSRDSRNKKESDKIKAMAKDEKKLSSYENRKATLAASREIFIAKLEEMVNTAGAPPAPQGGAAPAAAPAH